MRKPIIAIAILGLALSAWSGKAHTNTCTAEVRVFEDGSWSGGRLIYDGKVIDSSWDGRMARYGFSPTYKGTPCSITLR